MCGKGLTCLTKKTTLQSPYKQTEISTRASAASAELPCSLDNSAPQRTKSPIKKKKKDEMKRGGCGHTMHLHAG